MKADVVFLENNGNVKLLVVNDRGVATTVVFEKLSSLINYARECKINVLIPDFIANGMKTINK